jgi:hypothetical protein
MNDCVTSAIDILPGGNLCRDVYSVAVGVVWNCVCRLLFCIVITYGFEYVILEIK